MQYFIVMAMVYSFSYIYHKSTHCKEQSWSEFDSNLFAIIVAVIWPITLWFIIPHAIINLINRLRK